MAKIKIDKVVSALPGTLVANTVYAVRVGVGFDLYFVDVTGSVAHKLNPGYTVYTQSAFDALSQLEKDNSGLVIIDNTALNPNQFAISNAANPDNESNSTTGFSVGSSVTLNSIAVGATNGLYQLELRQEAAGVDADTQASIQIDGLADGVYDFSMDYNVENITGDFRITVSDPNTGTPYFQTITAGGALGTQTISGTIAIGGTVRDVLVFIRTSHTNDNFLANGVQVLTFDNLSLRLQ